MKKSNGVEVLVGTRKGAFIFRSNEKRKKWDIEGPLFPGCEVNHLTRDARSGALWAAMHTSWWGNDLQVNRSGKKWEKALDGLGFAQDRGLNLNRIWRVQPDNESRAEVLWCGVDPGALFRSDDGGKHWYEVEALTRHPTRERWMPGAGGLMVHHIMPHPSKPGSLQVAISAAGSFNSDDDGKTWEPRNKGVRTDFQPEKFPEVGQCVHSMVRSNRNPDWFFQQNHCGVYRSRNGGKSWQDISKGLPSRFGFAIAADPHEKETIYVVPIVAAEARYVCGGRLGVYRSTNGGSSWKLLTKGLPQKNVYTLVLRHGMATDKCEKTGVYVGTTCGEIYYSRNGGNRWNVMASHLPPVISVVVA